METFPGLIVNMAYPIPEERLELAEASVAGPSAANYSIAELAGWALLHREDILPIPPRPPAGSSGAIDPSSVDEEHHATIQVPRCCATLVFKKS